MRDRSTRTNSFFQIALPALALAALASPARAQMKIYDHFTGNKLSRPLWSMPVPSTISVANSLLSINGPPLSTFGNVETTHGFLGNFVIDLDWRNFRANNTVFRNNDPQIWLQVSEFRNKNRNFISVGRSLTRGGHIFFSGAMIRGNGVRGSSATTSATSGGLRIARTGSTISVFYRQGIAGWTRLHTFTNAFSGIVTAHIGSYSGDGGKFHVDSDWISYSGEMTPGRYGKSCGGIDAVHTLFPVLGGQFGFGIAGAKPNAPIIGALGATRLNVNLTGIGAPGCLWLSSFDIVFVLTANLNGDFMMNLGIPTDTRLLGLTVFGQWLSLDRSANALGLTFTDGIIIKIVR